MEIPLIMELSTGKLIGDGEPCYVIAEIGINANGSMENARKLIDAAADAGAQCVKLQKRTIDKVYSAEFLAQPREHPLSTDQTQRGQKTALEFSPEQHSELSTYARARGLDYSVSCWDTQAVEEMVSTIPDLPFLKLASASLTDMPVIEACKATELPLIASTGMSTLGEVYDFVDAWDVFYEDSEYEEHYVPGETSERLVLLHSCSAYPADDADLNLKAIKTLRTATGFLTGYSGHERGIATSVAAAAIGACVIERHITLDRTMYGSDQAASMEPHGFKRMVRDIRAVEAALGDGEKRVMDSEVPIREKLRG